MIEPSPPALLPEKRGKFELLDMEGCPDPLMGGGKAIGMDWDPLNPYCWVRRRVTVGLVWLPEVAVRFT